MSPIEIVLVAYGADNYGFLIHDLAEGWTGAIDAGEAKAYQTVLAERGWALHHIFLTHHHIDHVAGLDALKAATGAQALGPAGIDGVDHVLDPHDRLEMTDQISLEIIATPGHTLDMLNYHVPAAEAVFTGDTLFTLGCGRLFEGDAAMMWASLQRLAALPPTTKVYGAHDYTLANLDFALAQFPGHAALQKRADVIYNQRANGEPTVPSVLGEELATNPFLIAQDVQDFARLRAAKDVF